MQDAAAHNYDNQQVSAACPLARQAVNQQAILAQIGEQPALHMLRMHRRYLGADTGALAAAGTVAGLPFTDYLLSRFQLVYRSMCQGASGRGCCSAAFLEAPNKGLQQIRCCLLAVFALHCGGVQSIHMMHEVVGVMTEDSQITEIG